MTCFDCCVNIFQVTKYIFTSCQVTRKLLREIITCYRANRCFWEQNNFGYLLTSTIDPTLLDLITIAFIKKLKQSFIRALN